MGVNTPITGLSSRQSRELRRLIWVGHPTATEKKITAQRLIDLGFVRRVEASKFEATELGRAVALAGNTKAAA